MEHGEILQQEPEAGSSVQQQQQQDVVVTPSNTHSIMRAASPSKGVAIRSTNNEQQQPQRERQHVPANKEEKPRCAAMQRTFVWDDIYYIAIFGVLGAIVRVYMGRLLGGDCERSHDTDDYDFWQASHICLMSNGMTDNRPGGVLFIDLPANVLGSFIMGMLSASKAHPIPWLDKQHHLQRHSSWHKGLTTGFCGCLTTCK